jgi:acid phosphatase (class A)
MQYNRATRSRALCLPGLALSVLWISTAASQTTAPAVSQPSPTDRVGTSTTAARMPGFLEPHERPDSAVLVPAPPRPGTAAYAADLEAYRAMRALRETPRWRLAIADADLKFPHAASTFACALGMPITAATTPNLYVLLRRTMVDAGQSTAAAKDKYQRQRPFAALGEPMCVPQDAAALRKSGAYPSGHAAAGWAWALILAELAPDRAGQVLRRGYEFGLSRVVCGVHWPSDVETARTVGAAAVARLHADPEFMEQLARARQEVARVRAAAEIPTGPACDTEASALELTSAR